MSPRKIALILSCLTVGFLALPILFQGGPLASLCQIDAAAQENPCLAQEGTNARLVATNLVMGRTNEALQTQVAASPAQFMTVVVQITTTPSAAGTCQPYGVYRLQAGDTPFVVAEMYGLDVVSLLELNHLTEEDAVLLEIGQPLIVPLEECDAETESGPQPDDRPSDGTDRAALPTAAPDSQVVITQIVTPGTLETEAVILLNNGPVLNLGNWTLSDLDGNSYIISEGRRLFQNGQLTLYSRAGEDTPVALFWGLNEAVFETGDAAILTDPEGVIQAVLEIE